VNSDCTGNAEVPAKNLCSAGKCQPQCPNGEERDRPNDARTTAPEFWKLGDIFHSAPAMVEPPYSETLCNLGYSTQCLQTLYTAWGESAPGTKLSPTGSPNAYDNYVTANASRTRVVLTGANDGMLHAFYTGTQTATLIPGSELWAFIPPDMLPRLKFAMFGHQYYVDGNIMVRDVWTDANKDGVKQANEFHTLAVVTERSGGHSFVALDLTDPANPAFLWTFPQACTVESRLVGESWSDFPPRGPPIGPVRLKLPYAGSPADPLSRGWEERWIVMVNGGHDSTLVRGRGVWMVDAWTGNVLWSFTDADIKSGGKYDLGHGTKASLFPVAATIGLVDVGSADKPEGSGDAFFDTATFGDMGGNLWVARFWDPGVIDPVTTRVNNWFVSRAFEERRATDDSQSIAGRNPFFFMTGNTFDIERGYLRTYVGSGNRERLLDAQQTCSADNVLGCCQAGCTVVTSSTSDNYGTCQVAQSFSCSGGVLTTAPVSSSGTCTSPISCSQNNVTATLTLNCGSGVLPPITATLACDNAGLCTQVQPYGTGKVGVPAAGTTLAKNHMFGVWAYGGGNRTFNDKVSAQTFDTRRFTDVSYAPVCAATNGGACTLVDVTHADYTVGTGLSCSVGTICQAQTLDPGWMYEYGTDCPLQTCSPPPPWTDEKTATGAPPIGGCVLWSTTRPTGGSAGSDPCSSSIGAPTAYGYMVDYLAGTPTQACGSYGGSSVYQAASRNSPAPPQNPMPRIVVTADGQIKYTSLQMDAGSQPQSTTLGYRDAITELLYYLEVPRDLHTCRHVDNTTCK
jgi:type IV pilus assembly protein PilY1